MDSKKDISINPSNNNIIRRLFDGIDATGKTLPLIGSALWTVWTFTYREYITPKIVQQPLVTDIAVISIEDESKTVPKSSLERQVLLKVRVRISNKTSYDISLIQPIWAVYGFKITGSQTQRQMSARITDNYLRNSYTGRLGLSLQRSLVDAGNIHIDRAIKRGQEVSYSFPVIADGSKYSFLELRAYVSGVKETARSNSDLSRWFDSDLRYRGLGFGDPGLDLLTGICRYRYSNGQASINARATIGSALYELMRHYRSGDYRPSNENECVLLRSDDIEQLRPSSNFVATQVWIGRLTPASSPSSN